MLDKLHRRHFDVRFLHHAKAILEHDFPHALDELEEILAEYSVPIEEIIAGGGGEAKGTQRLRRVLEKRGWRKTTFTIQKTINSVTRESISHVVDHVRTDDNGKIALEIEWNNKDPFFDRDLENFQRLHREGAISVGIIVTRGQELQKRMQEYVGRFVRERGIGSLEQLKQWGYEPTPKQRKAIEERMRRLKNPGTFEEAFASKFVADKYGEATTHWRKLIARVDRGVGNPCPLLLIGFPASLVTFDARSDALGKAEAVAADDGEYADG